jgi:hypothetical protein
MNLQSKKDSYYLGETEVGADKIKGSATAKSKLTPKKSKPL